MLTADLRRAVVAAARDAGYPGEWRDAGLRDGGAPGRYTCSLPLQIAATASASAVSAVSADVIAQALAERLRLAGWIDDAEIAGAGYLAITVTDQALAQLAVRVTEAGPACARSDALRGTRRPAPPSTSLTASLGWPEAREQVSAQVTARLAAAAGATITADNHAERTPSSVPAASTGPVADALAFAGADAIVYSLARLPPERPADLDPRVCARHIPANPAYAVPYAYSCAASTLRWAAALDLSRGEAAAFRPGSLAHPRERALLAALSWLPEQVARAARRGRPHEFTAFLEDLAETYQMCRVACPAWPERGHDGARGAGLPGDAGTVRARLWLAGAAAAGLAAGLELLGVGAPGRLLSDDNRSRAGQRPDHEGLTTKA